MAKINTLNYQTVAAWNGSQDLFVVEQPDGTKVATPEQVKQYVLNDMDEVPTENSNNPVKSGGIFSTMAVPKYDATNRREYFEGGGAFGGNIDSSPTAGSNNAVASGGTKTYVDNAVSQLNDDLNGKCSVAAYNWNMGSVTADTIYTINNFKSTVGLSGKTIVAVGLVFVAGSSDYDYGATVIFRNAYDFARIKIAKTQSNTTACLYIIYTD